MTNTKQLREEFDDFIDEIFHYLWMGENEGADKRVAKYLKKKN